MIKSCVLSDARQQFKYSYGLQNPDLSLKNQMESRYQPISHCQAPFEKDLESIANTCRFIAEHYLYPLGKQCLSNSTISQSDHQFLLTLNASFSINKTIKSDFFAKACHIDAACELSVDEQCMTLSLLSLILASQGFCHLNFLNTALKINDLLMHPAISLTASANKLFEIALTQEKFIIYQIYEKN
ncbi:MAG: hypothetical protein JSS07_06625 [Proteobacteria bacterium]|nr:hypothetical protein [Pseudomonadota bacterium]